MFLNCGLLFSIYLTMEPLETRPFKLLNCGRLDVLIVPLLWAFAKSPQLNMPVRKSLSVLFTINDNMQHRTKLEKYKHKQHR